MDMKCQRCNERCEAMLHADSTQQCIDRTLSTDSMYFDSQPIKNE